MYPSSSWAGINTCQWEIQGWKTAVDGEDDEWPRRSRLGAGPDVVGTLPTCPGRTAHCLPTACPLPSLGVLDALRGPRNRNHEGSSKSSFVDARLPFLAAPQPPTSMGCTCLKAAPPPPPPLTLVPLKKNSHRMRTLDGALPRWEVSRVNGAHSALNYCASEPQCSVSSKIRKRLLQGHCWV